MLDNFFRINMPYGLKRNDKNEWYAFNREYLPLGWNDVFHNRDFSELPIHTIFKGLTNEKLLKIAPEESMVRYDEHGKINQIFFYKDKTNPTNNPKYWEQYLSIIKSLGDIKIATSNFA